MMVTGPVRAMVKFLCGVGLVVLLALLVFPAQAEEVIRSFSSNIVLEKDGTVDVTETIKVVAEGIQIRRGIFRDIPTQLRNDDGSVLNSNLTVISVKRDGRDEPFFTEDISGGIRIYVGKSDVFLSPGTYTYTLRYTMTRMARYFDDHDELFWNATGNFWSFPIEAAVAQVTLPEGAVISELAAYTGVQGSTGSDAKFAQPQDNVAVFRTTRPLNSREGLTVAVLFNKGVLIEPTGVEKFLNYLSDHKGTIFPLLAVLIILAYYYFAWDAVGRDPKKGTIIPLFRPPEGYSPALVHFISNMGWKKNGWTAFSAAIVSLATKGLVDIGGEGKKKTVFTWRKAPEKLLPRGEKVIYDYLQSEREVKVDKSTGPTLNKKRKEFITQIMAENRNAYFYNNYIYVGIGAALSFGLVLGMIALGIIPSAAGVSILIGGFGLAIMLSVVHSAVQGGGFGMFLAPLWIVIVAVNILGSLVPLFSKVRVDTGLIALVSIVVVNLVFLFLMRAPTVHGRKIMDQIEGFRMYLKTAEENRLNFSGEPEFTIRRFEEILPFAVALGVEKPWSQRLEGELARNTLAESQGGYHPGWYHGSGFSSRNLSSSISGIASGMSAAMLSAQPSSSSSSGGGGGGFSGGGGGGGGGGGW